MNSYEIGEYTMDYVFKKYGIENMCNVQAVMDAVEKALANAHDRMARSYQMFAQIASDADIFETPAAQSLLDILAEIET